MNKNESERLEAIAENSIYAKGTNKATIEYCAKVFDRFIKGDSILELGPAEGLMTEKIYRDDIHYEVVEGSSHFCEIISSKFPSIVVNNQLFEQYQPERVFDTIILGHVLEHVEEPAIILSKIVGWLKEGGVVLAAVPNSRSIHRQAAVLMGLLDSEKSMSEKDHRHGHRRIYDPESLRNDFMHAGFRIEASGGYWLKPVSDRQIESDWNDQMLDAFMALGERYPDIAGEIYVVGKKR